MMMMMDSSKYPMKLVNDEVCCPTRHTKARWMGLNLMWVVVWFVFHVLPVLPISFTQQNSCCINESRMKHMQKPDKKSDVP